MARRHGAVKRVAPIDPKYKSELVARVVHALMRDGKKSTAERIVYGAIEELRKAKADQDPLEVLNTAIANMKPKVEVKSRRVGGTTYPVPVPIREVRQLSLALRWMSQYASARRGTPMPKAVALELLDAFNGQGNVIKKRDDTHKMAQANKAFAHYAW
ncbi:MAG: 30S ribosomal protein S7 [Kiritimatiellae bacterium]|nr:30S ribosomal protein S7 [Kiritimatiellia bacterium]MBR4171069.1 30S ribosomal protein S7 [Kiritimatiellia bacterium]